MLGSWSHSIYNGIVTCDYELHFQVVYHRGRLFLKVSKVEWHSSRRKCGQPSLVPICDPLNDFRSIKYSSFDSGLLWWCILETMNFICIVGFIGDINILFATVRFIKIGLHGRVWFLFRLERVSAKLVVCCGEFCYKFNSLCHT